VKCLIEGMQSAGYYSVHWDGRDENGQSLASGIYFYRLTAGHQMQVRRMALIK